ncbi:DNA adenine methylase [Dactylococcopsis salina]|uniref:site-specific DNA-methyltransferase (adenine-specific) n=1 Tax=Dactylococcopsis salina (strain PCC 8305) TaxID=13035 RepID=K9YVG1_DACS8|nr:DNA adenine methylase [Dactylococcopsis salina]AFZ50879.1 adenine-specific DNA methylase [Dactylococcopsis salina PCC 8305]
METQGIKYAGSKFKLLPHIIMLAKKVNAHTILDGFSGTTRVSQAFAKLGYQVISNDVAIWSKVFAQCYLLNQQQPTTYQELIDHLNNLTPIDGWFTQNYGGEANQGCAIQKDGYKKPWQIHNTRKLDAIRKEIENLQLQPVEKAVALTSLILALDRVDNTIGHFVSYLKKWSPRSYNSLQLKLPNLFISEVEHQVFCCDIFDLIPHLSADLAYLDPPYGSNNEKMPPSRVRYASYYHLWKTICLFDQPQLFGKAKRRLDTSDQLSGSVFEDFRRNEEGRFLVVEAIEKLIQKIPVHWVILSYSSGGRATAAELNEMLQSNGKILSS